MGGFEWRKSTYSERVGGCVEVAYDAIQVSVRDTKGRFAVLDFSEHPWCAFVASLRTQARQSVDASRQPEHAEVRTVSLPGSGGPARAPVASGHGPKGWHPRRIGILAYCLASGAVATAAGAGASALVEDSTAKRVAWFAVMFAVSAASGAWRATVSRRTA